MTSIFHEKDKIEILVLDSEKNLTNNPIDGVKDASDNKNKKTDQNNEVQSQLLIQKCLKELVEIYRISTLIELCIFLVFLSSFFVYDFHNNNVYDAWAINKAVKKQFYISSLDPYKETDHKFSNIIEGFNSIVKSFDSLQDSDFFTRNEILPKSITLTNFETENKCMNILFEENETCDPIHSDEFTNTPTEKILIAYESTKDLKKFGGILREAALKLVNQATDTIQISMEMKFFNQALQSLTNFRVNVKHSPTGHIYYIQELLTFKVVSKNNLYFILVMITVYLFYYGHEKVTEIVSGDAFNSDRFLGDILDIASFSLAILTINYAYQISVRYHTSIDPSSRKPQRGDFNYLFPLNSNKKLKYSNLVLDLIYNCKENLTKEIKMICIEKLDKFSYDYNLFSTCFSIFSIFCISRLFKYAIIYRPLEIIVKSIRVIIFNIIEFSIFFLLVFFSFVLFGLSVFGSSLEEYQSFDKACLTLIGIIFGELHYEKYHEYSSLIGTFYFCSYVIVIFIIMFNILSVVITESYASVKNYLTSDSQKLHIKHGSAFIQRNFNYIIYFNLMKNKYEYDMRVIIETMVILKSSNRMLTKIEVETSLNSLGYDPDVLRSVLEKHGFSSSSFLPSLSNEPKWKKNQMDQFRERIDKERGKLKDIFSIYVPKNREIYEEKFNFELANHLFVSKERYYNFELKIVRLKNIIQCIDSKSAKLKSYKKYFEE